MKTRYFIAALALILAAAGCNKELDIPKHGNMGGMEEFYQTDEDAEAAVTAVYTSWRGIYQNLYFLKNALADDAWAGGGSRGDNSDYEKLNEYTFGTEHPAVEGLYTGLYSIIYNANLVIGRVADDTPVKKRAIAEAKFFRAWAHFELVSLWQIAPAVDHVLAPSEYKLPTGDPAVTWTLIETDLTEAISSGALPSKQGVGDSETGIRVTKETARALLGKAYVFQEKWDDARTELDAVINSGLYNLYRGDYGDVLRMVANNSTESLLEMQVRNDPNNAHFEFTELMCGWRFGTMDISSVNPAYADIATDAGYGFMNPRKSLYDAFVAREGADGYRLNQTMKPYAFLRDEMNMPIRPGETVYGCEGYFFWKNRILLSESVMGYPNFRAWQANNKRIMRYAEVLLLAAEAHLNGGDAGKAAKYVNEIRTRAKLAPLGSVTMNDVKIEKRLELCDEGCRFQDLVRWGDAQTVLADQGKEVMSFNGTAAVVSFTNSTYGFKAKHIVLPIPGKEIMLNENIHQLPNGW
uniref:Putative RagB-SusD domain-containing protein n=1 Tax=termite gut metagenome TaxID=433724 RepID=S0DGI2_9ZZZZ